MKIHENDLGFARIVNIPKDHRLEELMVTRRDTYRLSKVTFFRTSKSNKAIITLKKIDDHIDWYIRTILPNVDKWKIDGSFAYGHRLRWTVIC